MKIKSKDEKAFLLGILTMFAIVIIYDWNSFVNGLTGRPQSASSIDVVK